MASTADLPWHWVIETLADLKEADTSLLRAVISRVPDFSTNASESARKRVALRYMEEILGSHGADAPVSSDVVRSSKEVLGSHLNKGGSELFSHDLHQFTLHKRAALPKSSLELLKESILEGRCQASSSLKECSGLSRPNVVESAKKLKFWTNDGETHSQLQGSVALAPVSGDLILQEQLSGTEKHLPEQVVSDGDKRDHLHRNIVITGGNNVQLLEQVSTCQLFAEENVRHEIQSLNLGAAPDLANGSINFKNQLLPVQNVTDRDSGNHLHRDVISTGGNNAHFLRQSSLFQPLCKESISLQDAPLNGSRKNMNRLHCENDHFDGELRVAPDTPSDDSGFDGMPSGFDPNDEMFTSEKQRLLSSQVNSNYESISGDWSEHFLCIKCDKGGQLLSCSANGCSVAVHESCLGPLVNCKETSLFYCPFCSYTRAAIALCKVRKNVMRARKALSAFIGRDLVQGHRKNLPPERDLREISQAGVVGNENHQESHHSHQYQRGKPSECFLKAKETHLQTEAANACNKGNSSSGHAEVPISNVEMANNDQIQVQHNQLNDSANMTDNGNLTCGDKVTSHLRGNADVTIINGEGEVGNDCEHIGVTEHQQVAEPRVAVDNCTLDHEEVDAYQVKYCDVSRAKGKDEIRLVNDHAHLRKLRDQEQVKATPDRDVDKDTSTPQPIERHAKRRRKDTAVGKIHQPIERHANRRKSSSGSSSKHVVQPKRHSNPMVALGRRTRLLWTPEEEETLKDAMKRFAVDSDGNFPWIKILEFGRHTFHKTRQPGDLKDKWRNIRKKSDK